MNNALFYKRGKLHFEENSPVKVSRRIKSVENYEQFRKKEKRMAIFIASLFFSSWFWFIPFLNAIVHYGNNIKVFLGG